MNNQIYFSLMVVGGILISSIVIIFFNSLSKKLIRLFQLYPESKGILRVAFQAISWFIGIIVFLLFFRLGLKALNLNFTISVIEKVILSSPRYIIAIFIIIIGFYVTRLIKERSRDYYFEYKGQLLMAMDFMIHLAFILTAFYSIGINVSVFLEIYKILLWIIAAVIILVISMAVGIPLGINVYKSTMRKSKK